MPKSIKNKVNHAKIVFMNPCYKDPVGEIDGIPYIAMEIANRPLKQKEISYFYCDKPSYQLLGLCIWGQKWFIWHDKLFY